MTSRLLPTAQLEALDAADWYDGRATGLGVQFLTALDDLVHTLEAHPQLYPRARGAPAARDIREAPLPGFPWIAAYEIISGEVVVLSVTHGHSVRQPWRTRRP
ncbi:MAG: type II toxin-antitoxin system RelE/ParE family toxin [Gemmataceae bacterium]